MARNRFLAVALGLVVLAGLSFAAAPSPTEVQQLVDQLGARKFSDREKAQKALDQIGAPALSALEKAVTHEDPEVQRRAKELIRVIKGRVENAQILQATMIKLSFKDAPLLDAVKSLATQTKLPIEVLRSDEPKLKDRMVTIETGEISLWEAVDKFCVAASLNHRAGVQQPFPVDDGRFDRLPPNALPPNAPVARPVPPQQYNPNAIVLADGKPETLPTVYAGAARIRLIDGAAQGQPVQPPVRPPIRPLPLERPDIGPAVPPQPAVQPNTGKNVGLYLEVTLEPKIQLRGQMTFKIEKAVDDKEQALTRVALADDENANGDADTVVFNGPNGVVMKQAFVNNMKLVVRPGYYAYGTGIQRLPLQLKLPENAGKKISTLKGVVEAPINIVSSISIDEVMKAEKKVHKNADGLEFKFNGIKTNPNGIVEVEVEVDYSKSQRGGVNGFNGAVNWAAPMNNVAVAFAGQAAAPAQVQVQAQGQVQIQVNGQAVPVQVQGRPAIAPAPAIDGYNPNASNGGFVLRDDKGQVYYPAGMASNATGNGPVTMRVMFRHPQGPAAGITPKSLTYTTPRPSTVEIPFEFKDVPLK